MNQYIETQWLEKVMAEKLLVSPVFEQPMYKWNHKFKRRWVAALRGGSFTQCFGQWEKHDAMCAGQVGVTIAQQMYRETGINHSAYEMMPAGFMDQVIRRNDELQWSFKMIADFIEAAD